MNNLPLDLIKWISGVRGDGAGVSQKIAAEWMTWWANFQQNLSEDESEWGATLSGSDEMLTAIRDQVAAWLERPTSDTSASEIESMKVRLAQLESEIAQLRSDLLQGGETSTRPD